VEGTPFGQYRLIELLGRGGMGEVWKAFDTATQRVVAVKVLPAQLAADPVFEARFRREAFTAAALTEPHVVPIHNFGEIEGRLYVDMRLIEGQDLEHVLAKGPLDSARSVKIVEQVASALNAAHRVGLVHRDVKPSNILLAEDDFAYLIDFGIARGTDETGLTGTGNVVGTWPYMAPERFTTGQADTRADIYALACVLYECLTASRPFPGQSVEQQIAGHLTTPPPRPSINRPGISRQLDAVVAKGMAKDPEQRYATTTEMARAARSAITAPIPKVVPHDPERTVVVAPSEAPTRRRVPEGVDEAWAPTKARPGEVVPEPWTAAHEGATENMQANSAPTQARPAEAHLMPTQARIPPDVHLSAPAAARPVQYVREAEIPPLPWWQRRAIVIPIAAILMIAAIATILTVVLGKKPTTPPKNAPAGALDGSYAVQYAAATMPNGQPYDNAPGGRETWVLQSACSTGNTCVATASKVSGSESTASTMVLDKISNSWTGVSAVQGTCQNASTEFWESMSLQPQSDGSLTGEFVVRSTTSCARNQQVTFTRTGDIAANASIADPKTQPARVPSPAAGLRGNYQETDTNPDGGVSPPTNFNIQTYCLRTGDRCLSYWQNPKDPRTFLFAQNTWNLTTTSADGDCPKGGRAHREMSLQFPLPAPTPNPITLLTGHGHYTMTGDCPAGSDFDARVERTGD
jgi:serine/threonine-protein kinase